MKLSEQINRSKYFLERGGIVGYNSLGSTTYNILQGLGNIGLSYTNGLQIGQSLGYNQNSQRNLGTIGAINAGLNLAAGTIQQGRRNKEERERFNQLELDEYVRVPRDIYNYSEYSSTPYQQSYFQDGGQIKELNKYSLGGEHGYWTESRRYTKGSPSALNIYDSATSVPRNKQIGKSSHGFTSAHGKPFFKSSSKIIAKKNKKNKKNKVDYSSYSNYNSNKSVYSYMNGGINNTGYTKGSISENNPYNIIPSNHITAEPMDKNTVIKVTPIFDRRFDRRLGKPFKYRKGMQDIIAPIGTTFLEEKL